MLTGEIRGQINAIRTSFWTDGICNPLEVAEQIADLPLIDRLDELRKLEERRASGACGLPVTAEEYNRQHHSEDLRDDALRRRFKHGLFHGFDCDCAVPRIGRMSTAVPGVENPDIDAALG